MTTKRLRVLYVMDSLAQSHPDKDTTFALMLEGQARGHDNVVCDVNGLFADGANGFALACQAQVMRPSSDGAPHFTLAKPQRLAFADLDVIWMRKDPPVDDGYLFACMILDLADPARTLVLNNPRSLRVVHEKMWPLQFPDLMPKTVVAANRDVLTAFVKQQGKGVLKPLHLMGGMGVMVFSADDPNLRSAADLLTHEGKRHAIAQEFLPAVKVGDKRVILLDGIAIGAVLRVPRADDVRSNLHVGGTAVRATIDDDDRAIAARIGPLLQAQGLFLVGIDVIGGKLTEVNVTSPTGIQEIDRLDGRSGADRIASVVWQAIDSKLRSMPSA